MRITIDQAKQLLLGEEVVAVPTETVYGLAACLHCPDAIKKIYILKGRPSNNPLIIHVSSPEEIQPFITHTPPFFKELAEAFWPGPLTLILPIHEDKVPTILRAGLPTAGFRVPSHPLARELIKLSGPLVMPSANLSGRPSSTSFSHVEDDFGPHFPVLDGGFCNEGLESTILLFRESRWVLARLGALSADEFIPILGYRPVVECASPSQKQPLCPGQLYRHYAPKAKLTLGSQARYSNEECIIGFRDRSYPSCSHKMIWGTVERPFEVAENLYSVLRRLDRNNIITAWIDDEFPSGGLWETLKERLRRASQE